MDASESSRRAPNSAADRDWLSKLALRLVRDPELADEACQEAWLVARRKLEREGQAAREPNRGSLSSALKGVLMHLGRSDRRRRFHERRAARDEALPSTVDLLLVGERQQLLWQHVASLPEPYRTALLLRFQQGLDTKTLAKRQGLPEDTVRWRIRRGLALLKESLEREASLPGLMGMVPVAVLGARRWEEVGAATSIAPWVIKLGALGMWKYSSVGLAAALVLWFVVSRDSGRALPSETARADVSVSLEGEPDALASVAPESRQVRRTTAEPAKAQNSSASQSERTDAVLVGRIADEFGDALAGVDLRLEHGGWKGATVSDADGRFELLTPRQTDYCAKLFVEPSRYFQQRELWFGSDDDCVRAAITLNRMDLGDVRLERAAVLVGRVHDAGGQPVAGAEIEGEEQACRTDAGGEFVLAHLDPDEHELRIRAAGFVTRTVAVKLEPRRESDLGIVQLDAGPVVRGTVVGPDGNRVGGARVEDDESGVVTRADATGHYTLILNHAGPARIRACADGYRASPWVNSDVDVELTLTLGDEGAPLRLRIVDKETGTELPAAGARVRVAEMIRRDERDRLGPVEERTLSAIAAADGGILWQGRAERGRDEFRVSFPGHRPKTGMLRRSAFASGGQVIKLEKRFTGSLTGRFLDEGEPLANHQFELYLMTTVLSLDGERFDPGRPRRFHTDADGRFTIHHGGTGQVKVVAWLEGHRLAHSTTRFVRRTDKVDLGDCHALPACALSGTVRFEDGRPYAQSRVTLSEPLNQTVRTDDAGRYEFTDLLPGQHRLRFDDVHYRRPFASGSESPAVRTVELAPAEGRQLDFVLAPSMEADAVATVEIVATLNGEPMLVTDWDCGLEGPDGVALEDTERHRENRFWFRAAPGDEYTFWAEADNDFDGGPMEFPGRLRIVAGMQRIELAYETSALCVHLPATFEASGRGTALLWWNDGQHRATEPLVRQAVPLDLERSDPSLGIPIEFPHVPTAARGLRLVVTTSMTENALVNHELEHVTLVRGGRAVVRCTE